MGELFFVYILPNLYLVLQWFPVAVLAGIGLTALYFFIKYMKKGG